MDRMVVAVATRLSCLSNSMENLNMHQCSLKNLLHMSSIPLEVLKRGFSEFSRKINIRKDKLNAKLSQGEAISISDKQWLDNDGNTIDKEHILEALELAPDYKKAAAELDDNRQGIMKKLKEWAGYGTSLAKVAGNKRKRTHPSQP